jgi:hypothetical protein
MNRFIWIFAACLIISYVMLTGDPRYSPFDMSEGEAESVYEHSMYVDSQKRFLRYVYLNAQLSGSTLQIIVDAEECWKDDKYYWYTNQYILKSRDGKSTNRYRYEEKISIKTGAQYQTSHNLTERPPIKLDVTSPDD